MLESSCLGFGRWKKGCHFLSSVTIQFCFWEISFPQKQILQIPGLFLCSGARIGSTVSTDGKDDALMADSCVLLVPEEDVVQRCVYATTVTRTLKTPVGVWAESIGRLRHLKWARWFSLDLCENAEEWCSGGRLQVFQMYQRGGGERGVMPSKQSNVSIVLTSDSSCVFLHLCTLMLLNLYVLPPAPGCQSLWFTASLSSCCSLCLDVL